MPMASFGLHLPVIRSFSPNPEPLIPAKSEPKVFSPIGDQPPPLINPVGLPTDRPPMKADDIPAAPCRRRSFHPRPRRCCRRV